MPRDEGSHKTGDLNTEGERGNIKREQVSEASLERMVA